MNFGFILVFKGNEYSYLYSVNRASTGMNIRVSLSLYIRCPDFCPFRRSSLKKNHNTIVLPSTWKGFRKISYVIVTAFHILLHKRSMQPHAYLPVFNERNTHPTPLTLSFAICFTLIYGNLLNSSPNQKQKRHCMFPPVACSWPVPQENSICQVGIVP